MYSMEPKPFDHFEAMRRIAVQGSFDGVQNDLDARAASHKRISADELSRNENQQLILEAGRPKRWRIGVNFSREPIWQAIDWKQAQAYIAAGLIGIFSSTAITGFINHQTRPITPELPITVPPTIPREFITRTPDGKATLDLEPFLKNPDPSRNIRP